MSTLPAQAEAGRAPLVAEKRGVRSFFTRTTVGVLSVSLFLLVWQTVGVTDTIRSDLISYPSEIVVTLIDLIRSGELGQNLLVSVQEFVIGFVPAVVLGIAMGMAFALSRRLLYLFEPLFAALYTAPMIAFVPILVVWCGVGMQSKAVMVFLSALIPIVINTQTGVKEIPSSWIRALEAYGATRTQVVLKGLLPGALPAIMAGLRLAVGRSIVSLIAAEMYVSVLGIGRLVQVYGTSDRAAPIFVLVLVISGCGFASVVALRMLERRLAPWSATR